MNQDKAIERIQMLLRRTEDNGASPAEADTAARMVCKLLVQFPLILSAQAERFTFPRRRKEDETGVNAKVPVRYQAILMQTAKSVLLSINGNEVWLPLSKVTFKTQVVMVPRWLAEAKDLI